MGFWEPPQPQNLDKDQVTFSVYLNIFGLFNTIIGKSQVSCRSEIKQVLAWSYYKKEDWWCQTNVYVSFGLTYESF